MELRDAFELRKDRFRLLDKGLVTAHFEKTDPLLEAGCASGGGVGHLMSLGYTELTAFDIDATAIDRAREKFPDVKLFCADARELPFDDGAFKGIVSEAAFSVISGKEKAAKEYARVLKKGGRVLMDDFAILSGAEIPRDQGIPCLDGVQTMDRYRAVFTSAGFKMIYQKEEFGEYIGIAMSLGRSYGVKAPSVGKFIVSAFGRDGYVTDFFAHTRLTYCQMIFEKV